MPFNDMGKASHPKLQRHDASEEETDRDKDVGNFAITDPRYRAENTGSSNASAKPHDHAACHRPAGQREFARGHRDQSDKLRNDHARGHQERCLGNGNEAGRAPLSNNLVDRGNEACAATLDGKTHDASADRRDGKYR